MAPRKKAEATYTRFHLVQLSGTQQDGTEMSALLRTCGDTVAALKWKYPDIIEVWRDGRLVTNCRTLKQVYDLAQKKGW